MGGCFEAHRDVEPRCLNVGDDDLLASLDHSAPLCAQNHPRELCAGSNLSRFEEYAV